ncbi:MAG: carboxypeptidase-like regulatory domain-containing protein [Halalkalicoccus sp.]|nr:carboxypeptidase-like regulatory domain-containing protein [Halalkalicoccus sp.]
MTPERHGSRRRFLGLAGALGVAALAGCTDEESSGNGDGEGNGGEEAASEGTEENTEADESGSESGAEHGNPESENDLPNVEGTNLFVRVVDGEGAAVEGATVTVTGGAFDAEAFETDADGRIIEQGVEPGEYTVTAALDGEEAEESFTLSEGEDESIALTLPLAGAEGEEADDGGENEGNGTATNGSDGTAD